MGRTTYWVWSIKRRMMGFWVLVRLWIRLYDPQFLPVPTQDHSGPLVCRRGQAGDKLLNAAAAPCNFSGYRESAGAWLTSDYPSPSLRVSVWREESSHRQSVRVLSLLIALESLFSVVWYLQPGMLPNRDTLYVYSCEKQKTSNIDHAVHRLVFDVNAVVWTSPSTPEVLIRDVLFPVYIWFLTCSDY